MGSQDIVQSPEEIEIWAAKKRGDVATLIRYADYQNGDPEESGSLCRTKSIQTTALFCLRGFPGEEISRIFLRKLNEYTGELDEVMHHPEFVEALAMRDDTVARAFTREILRSTDARFLKAAVVGLGEAGRTLEPEELDLLIAKLDDPHVDFHTKKQAFAGIAASNKALATDKAILILNRDPPEDAVLVFDVLDWAGTQKLKLPLAGLKQVIQHHPMHEARAEAIRALRRLRTKEAKHLLERIENEEDLDAEVEDAPQFKQRIDCDRVLAAFPPRTAEMPNGWLEASANVGDNRWGEIEGGLPGRKPKWQMKKCGTWGVHFDLCMSNGAIFACSAQREVVCVDAESGEYRWRTPLPAESAWGIAINHERVAVFPYLLERETGQIVANVLNFAGARFPDIERGIFNYGNEGEFTAFAREPAPELLHVRNDGSHTFAPSPHGFLRQIRDHLYIGYESERRGLFGCRAPSDEILWRISFPLAQDGRPMLPSGFMPRIGTRLYVHLNFDTLWCIDLTSGTILWKNGADEIEQNATPYVCGAPSFILGCADGIYLCKTIDDAGFLQAHSTEDGRCLWRADAPQARALAIAGDLIFGSLHDVPVALGSSHRRGSLARGEVVRSGLPRHRYRKQGGLR